MLHMMMMTRAHRINSLNLMFSPTLLPFVYTNSVDGCVAAAA